MQRAAWIVIAMAGVAAGGYAGLASDSPEGTSAKAPAPRSTCGEVRNQPLPEPDPRPAPRYCSVPKPWDGKTCTRTDCEASIWTPLAKAQKLTAAIALARHQASAHQQVGTAHLPQQPKEIHGVGICGCCCGIGGPDLSAETLRVDARGHGAILVDLVAVRAQHPSHPKGWKRVCVRCQTPLSARGRQPRPGR